MQAQVNGGDEREACDGAQMTLLTRAERDLVWEYLNLSVGCEDRYLEDVLELLDRYPAEFEVARHLRGDHDCYEVPSDPFTEVVKRLVAYVRMDAQYYDELKALETLRENL